jgi:hypothetical protein
MAKKSGRRPPPKCKAILICEQVIVEAVTGKCSIIGVLQSFFVDDPPSKTDRFSVFLQLTNGHGEYGVTIEIHDMEDGEVLATLPDLTVELPDRLSVKNLIIVCPPLTVEHPGSYDLVVFADDEEIDRQRFQIHSRDEIDEDE